MQTEWSSLLQSEFEKPYFKKLQEFVTPERRQFSVYPSPENVMAALELTTYADTRVVILGQDPYHGVNQAHGLCFSVQRDVVHPPSLKNIFKELQSDLKIKPPINGNLEQWARQGVLMLNTTLTVRAGEAGSHQGFGWETFTDAIIRIVNNKSHCLNHLPVAKSSATAFAGFWLMGECTPRVVLFSTWDKPLFQRTYLFRSSMIPLIPISLRQLYAVLSVHFITM